MRREEYPSQFHCAWAYETPVTDPTRHMPFLRDQIIAMGGRFLRQRVGSLQELYEMFPDSSIFINASGVGSQTLADVQDDRCFPERGQNVFLRTDQCHTLYFRNGSEYTYVIPRPLSHGVVLGGVKQQDNLYVSHRLSPGAEGDIAPLIRTLPVPRMLTWRLHGMRSRVPTDWPLILSPKPWPRTR